MNNGDSFVYLCILIANLFLIASYFNDSPFLVLTALFWVLIAIIGAVMDFSSTSRRIDFKFELKKAEHQLETIKHERIAKLLEGILITLNKKTKVKKK